MRKTMVGLGLLALLLLWPVATAFADGGTWQFDGGQIFTNEDVALEAGERFEGDLGVFNGNLELPPDSSVNGDVFVANGKAHIAGRVNGNLAVIGGELDLADSGWVAGDVFSLGGKQSVAGHVRGDLAAVFGNMALRGTAVVEGDLLVAPGNIEREAGAQVFGEEVHDFTIPSLPAMPEVPEFTPPAPPEVPEFTPPALPEVPEWTPPVQPYAHRETFGQRVGRFVGRALSAGLLSLLFIAIGALVVLIWPRATHKVADCIATLPAQSFGLGLLTFLIAVGLQILAVILMVVIILVATVLIGTVILIPVGILLILLSLLVLLPVPLALAGAMILGWVGLAELIGQSVLKILRINEVKPLGAVLVGLFITVPVTGMLWILHPVCCAWPFAVLLTSVGLGAVVHTRFGREDCRAPQPIAAREVLPAEAMDDEAGQPDAPPTP